MPNLDADVRVMRVDGEVVNMPVMEGPALVVVWADPGVTTGWSVHRVNIDRLLRFGQVGTTEVTWSRVGQFRPGDTTDSVDAFLALCRAAWEQAGEEDVVVVGCESFTLMMQSTDPALLEPVRFLAVLKDRLRQSGSGVEVQVQGASEMKKTITEERLRLWGVWHSGLVHGRDAQRHCLLFLRRFASQPELRRRVGWVDG